MKFLAAFGGVVLAALMLFLICVVCGLSVQVKALEDKQKLTARVLYHMMSGHDDASVDGPFTVETLPRGFRADSHEFHAVPMK